MAALGGVPRELQLPSPHEPHVWWLPSGELTEAGQIVSADETQLASRFAQHADRGRFLEGRAFLRMVLGSYAGLPAPEDLRFDAGPYGKPRLHEAVADLDFSFSRTTGLFAVAIATGGRVGLDVEARNRLEHAGRALVRALSPRDASLSAFRGAQDLDVLVENWVAKEALLKAVGVGLTRDPREIHLGPWVGRNTFLWQAAGADPDFGDSTWTVISLSIVPGYACSLAKEGNAKDVLITRYVM